MGLSKRKEQQDDVDPNITTEVKKNIFTVQPTLLKFSSAREN